MRAIETGHYQVAAAGELSDALGWIPGDILLSVDGYDLGGIGPFTEAYAALSDGSTFTLTLERERAEVQLVYRVE